MRQSPAEWLTLDHALRLFGRSKATLYRFVKTGQIATLQTPQPGRKPESLFRKADILQMKETGSERKQRMSKVSALVPHQAASPAIRQPTTALIASPRPVLRLEEAAAEFGLPANYLLELVQQKAIPAVKRGAWYLSRRGLERFIENGFSQVS